MWSLFWNYRLITQGETESKQVGPTLQHSIVTSKHVRELATCQNVNNCDSGIWIIHESEMVWSTIQGFLP